MPAGGGMDKGHPALNRRRMRFTVAGVNSLAAQSCSRLHHQPRRWKIPGRPVSPRPSRLARAPSPPHRRGGRATLGTAWPLAARFSKTAGVYWFGHRAYFSKASTRFSFGFFIIGFWRCVFYARALDFRIFEVQDWSVLWIVHICWTHLLAHRSRLFSRGFYSAT